MSIDPVENIVAIGLQQRGIRYIQPDPITRLDFKLPDYDGLLIEVKRFHTARAVEQLSRAPNVILIQGLDAAIAFSRLINGA